MRGPRDPGPAIPKGASTAREWALQRRELANHPASNRLSWKIKLIFYRPLYHLLAPRDRQVALTDAELAHLAVEQARQVSGRLP